MGAPDLLASLSGLGIRLWREGDRIIASPRAALTDELRGLIRRHKAELLRAVSGPQEDTTQAPGQDGTLSAQREPDAPQALPGLDGGEENPRMQRALAYLQEHPDVKRACFADAKADPENIVLTVAVREPWGAVEVLISRDRFDPFALIELVNRYADTSLFIPEH